MDYTAAWDGAMWVGVEWRVGWGGVRWGEEVGLGTASPYNLPTISLQSPYNLLVISLQCPQR